MSNLQLIEKLTGIVEDLLEIVRDQQSVLNQYDCAEFDAVIAEARGRYIALLGADEWPDDIER